MKFVMFPFVRFSFFFAAGIIVAHHLPLSFYVFPFLSGILVVTVILWILARNQIIQNVFFGTGAYATLFLLGCFNYQIRLPEYQSAHYSNQVKAEKPVLIHLKITENLKEDNYSRKYFARIISVDNQSVNGKVLLNIAKDSTLSGISPDDVMLVKSEFLVPPESVNPYQFSYANYLRTEMVHHQLFLSKENIFGYDHGKSTVFGAAQNFRNSIIDKLRKTELTTDERAIIQALILGDKRDISKELYQQYAAAGAVHILAVSGLHVGILFVILSFIFKPIIYFKHGAIIRSLLIITILWGFAFLAGLSPSVMRAVFMFSFFAVALLFKRKTSGINTLALSFVMLTLINPMNIFKVGFQLSYCAVFFIIWLNPFFKQFTYSRFLVWREAKSIMAVTLSAQIGVLPLTLLYFHQFPGLFLITNLVVLPVLVIYMAGGIIIIFLAYFEALPFWLSMTYNFLVRLLNQFVGWVASHDKFLLKDIHFSSVKALSAYLLLFSVGLLLMKPMRSRLIFASCSYALLIIIFIQSNKTNTHSELILFHKSRESVMAYKQGKHLTVFVNDTTQNIRRHPFLTAYLSEKNIHKFETKPFPKALEIKGQTVTVLDSSNFFPSIRGIDFVILTNNPRINIERMIDSISPAKIIADGSNYPWYVERWLESAEKRKLPFHYTAKDGAIKIE